MPLITYLTQLTSSTLGIAERAQTTTLRRVQWVEAGLWGLAGGFIAEGLDLYSVVRSKGTWPWRVPPPDPDTPVGGPLAYLIVETVRMVIGGLLAGAAGASGQVSGPLAAVAIGIATPLAVAKLSEPDSLANGITAAAEPSNANPPAPDCYRTQPAAKPADVTARSSRTPEGEATP